MAPVHYVTAIQFGRHLHGELAATQRLERNRGVGCGDGEIPTQSDEHLHVAAEHRLQATDGIEPMLARWVDLAPLCQTLEERRRRSVIDPTCPVALDVAVAADRRWPRPSTSDVPAKQ